MDAVCCQTGEMRKAVPCNLRPPDILPGSGRLLLDRKLSLIISRFPGSHLPVYQISTVTNARLSLGFALSVHFGKSGFSAYFFKPNPDIRILSGFFVQVRIGPYIPFSNLK